MDINFMRLPADEAERLCYAEGFENAALLFARIEALEAQVKDLTRQNEQLNDALTLLPCERDE